MKIYIAFDFIDGPSGGGNQFLRNLHDEFLKKGVYCNDPSQADVILFNGHHNPNEIGRLKNKFSNKFFVHRIDGVYKLYNRPTDIRQDISFKMNEVFSDATVFQSKWAYTELIKQGLNLQNKPNRVISNAADNKVFFSRPSYLTREHSDKINIVSTGWSDNPNKGTSFYNYLDSHLDFSKYTLTFIGNSPTKFKNAKSILPLNREDLANELKSKDIFFFPSKYECCSNSLIEGISCGLIAIALNSGGNIELINRCNAGVLFDNKEDLICKIKEISYNIKERREGITPPVLDIISNQYINFFKRCIESTLA